MHGGVARLPGDVLESRVSFSRAVEPGIGTVTTVTYGSGTRFGEEVLRTEKHYFYGTAETGTGTPGYSYSAWKTGLEYKTEVLGHRQVEHVHAQRVCSPWYPQVTGVTRNPCAPASYQEQEPAMDPRVVQTRTTLLDGVPNVTSKEVFSYDQFNNKTQVVEYNFGESEAMRTTAIDYRTDAEYVNASGDTMAVPIGHTSGAHLRSLVTKRRVCAGAGPCTDTNALARTDFFHDEGTLATNAAVQWQQPQTGPGAATKRGNVTREVRYASAGNPLTATITYDRTGNVLTATNPRGKMTTISYADNCSAGPLNTFAFATSVTNAAGHVTQGRYDCALGRPVQITGPNSDVTTFDYNDLLDRIKSVTRGAGSALGARTLYTYSGNTPTGDTVTIQADRDAFQDGLLKTVVEFDGLGREWIRKQYETATGHIDSKKQYDGLGRVARVCNPFRKEGGAADTWAEGCGATESVRSQYDGLDRVVTTTNQDGTQRTVTYAGAVTTVADEGNQTRRRQTLDALGRLISVVEEGGTQPSTTAYTYDLLDNLKTVTQGPQGVQAAREFAYDMVSRLTSAKNPESGATGSATGETTYQYDANGNLQSRADARGATVTMAYDDLDRVTSKTYGGPAATPTATWTYDACVYGKGRVCTSAASGVVTRTFSYDLLGRVVGSGGRRWPGSRRTRSATPTIEPTG